MKRGLAAKALEKIAATTQQAMIALGTGDVALAERLFRKAAAAKPVQPQTLYNLGVFLRQQDRAAEALPVLKQARRLAPNHLGAAIELCLAHLDRDELTVAERAANAAVALAPEDPDALSALAVSQFRLGQWQASAKTLAKLGRRRPLSEEEAILHLRALLECQDVEAALATARGIGANAPVLSGELLSALTRRASGRVSLNEAHLREMIGLSGRTP